MHQQVELSDVECNLRGQCRERQRDHVVHRARSVGRVFERAQRAVERAGRVVTDEIRRRTFGNVDRLPREGRGEHVTTADDVVHDVSHRPLVARRRIALLIGLHPADERAQSRRLVVQLFGR